MASEARWPRPEEAPALEDLTKCVHCGLCLNACPTYVISGLEAESPRGRIYFARAIEEGVIGLTATVQGHWDRCLQCRACEAVCPSGVPYGRIMEHARTQLDAAAPAGRAGRRWRKLLLRQVVARPRVLAVALAPIRAFARTPLRQLARLARTSIWAGAAGRGIEQLPRGQGRPFRAGQALARPERATTEAVLFTGCVMGELFGEVHRATGRVLARSGVATRAPAEQGCCGALHAHDGDVDFARKLARKCIEAFDDDEARPIIVNSAGCGAAMKEYGDLLASDPAYAQRAREFGARVKDLTEYLVSLGELPAGVFAARSSYQHPCHLAHAQRIREQPRALLRSLTGLELVETSGDDMCCGAAGIYSIVQPEISAELRTRKAEEFRRCAPEVVVTANPGCQMQYEAAVLEAGIKARVMHIAEVLDEAYRGADKK